MNRSTKKEIRKPPPNGPAIAQELYKPLPKRRRRRRKKEVGEPSGRTLERSPAKCLDNEQPDLAAYAAAHELGFTHAEYAQQLLAGLLHGLAEARHGAGGQRP